MNAAGFAAELARRACVWDGAMGTQLMAAGLPVGACGVVWNVERAAVVEGIHRRYLDAGCDVITTNTFQASRTALRMHGLSPRVLELNRGGAAVARRAAAGRKAWVAADIGPFGGFLEPLGDTTLDELVDIFTQQLTAMREGGADMALIETMSDPAEVAAAVRAARSVSDWPVVATYAFQRAGEAFVTMMGTSVNQACAAAIEAGATVVGANCGTALDLDAYAQLAEQLLRAAGDVPVIVQPNAGSPVERDGAWHYLATPQEMAGLARRLVDLGVSVIGGCCGTTPEHLRAMAREVRCG